MLLDLDFSYFLRAWGNVPMSQVYLNEGSLVPSIHEFCKKFGEVIDGLPNVGGHIVTYLKGTVAFACRKLKLPLLGHESSSCFGKRTQKMGH